MTTGSSNRSNLHLEKLRSESTTVFVLRNVAQTLAGDLENSDLADVDFVEENLSELQWLRKGNRRVSRTVQQFVHAQPDHVLTLLLQQLTLDIDHQVNSLMDGIKDGAIAAFDNPNPIRYQLQIEVATFSLQSNLDHLYRCLQRLSSSDYYPSTPA